MKTAFSLISKKLSNEIIYQNGAQRNNFGYVCLALSLKKVFYKERHTQNIKINKPTSETIIILTVLYLLFPVHTFKKIFFWAILKQTSQVNIGGGQQRM